MLERRPLGDAFIIETTSTMVAPRSPTTQQPTRREWILEPAWILQYLAVSWSLHGSWSICRGGIFEYLTSMIIRLFPSPSHTY